MQAKNDKWLNGGTDKGKWEDNFTDNITESFDDTKNVTYARIAKYLKDLSLDKPTDFRLVPKEKEADELGDKLKQAQILESEARAWALRHPRSSGGGGSAATDSVIRRRLNDLDVSYNKLLGQLKDANNENLVKSINGEMARNRAERYSLLKKLGESGSLEGVKIDTKKGGVSFDNPTLDIAAGDWEQGEQGQQEQKNTHNPLNLSPKDFQNLRLKNRVGSVVVFNNGQKIKITAQGYELLT
jgi:hypothetical protein